MPSMPSVASKFPKFILPELLYAAGTPVTAGAPVKSGAPVKAGDMRFFTGAPLPEPRQGLRRKSPAGGSSVLTLLLPLLH